MTRFACRNRMTRMWHAVSTQSGRASASEPGRPARRAAPVCVQGMAVTAGAIQLLGGYGYTRDFLRSV